MAGTGYVFSGQGYLWLLVCQAPGGQGYPRLDRARRSERRLPDVLTPAWGGAPPSTGYYTF